MAMSSMQWAMDLFWWRRKGKKEERSEGEEREKREKGRGGGKGLKRNELVILCWWKEGWRFGEQYRCGIGNSPTLQQ